MNDSPAYWVGRLLPSVLFGCLCIFFLMRAVRANSLSLKLANASLFCGLASFFLPELALGFTAAQHGLLFRGLGIIRLAFGLAGLALGILALVYRTRDQGTGLVRPLVGSGFSVLHSIVGAFY